jgi:hypothetical protein
MISAEGSPSPLLTGLPENLSALIRESASPARIHAVVRVAHSLARAYLARRQNSEYLAQTHGLDRNQLAYDCIAELFQRDDAGSFVQIRAYFLPIPIDETSPEQLLLHLQRLVFSKAQHALFRMHQEADPALGKILRNIKASLVSLRQFTESERFGSPCIAPALCETLAHLPPPDDGVLEERLGDLIRGDERIPEMLGRLSQYLRDQEEHSRIVPLLTVARLFQSAYARKRLTSASGHAEELNVTEIDCRSIIADSCRRVRARQGARYVRLSKLSDETLDMYLGLIEDSLSRRFVYNDAGESSLFEDLRSRIPDLTASDYHNTHKAKLEYLNKCVAALVVTQLQMQ